MPNFLDIESDFLDKLISIIEGNMQDEDFGVSELADHIGMSRSNLLRKTQKIAEISVSILIRLVRLHHAQQYLRSDDLTASEVSFKVGFNSVSYFTKCFRDHYGYPPGEEKIKFAEQKKALDKPESSNVTSKKWLLATLVLLAIILLAIFLPKLEVSSYSTQKKSIAVLPFKNDSNDSSNLHIINGLMEAVLSNLQKIEDLRVVSRTSVEQYRESDKSITEISKELGVNYILEGSGQKLGDKILLTVQLIEAQQDSHLWSEQYNRLVTDIFNLQAEVAKDIAGEIKVIVTPDEAERIERIPTENIQAYEYYLKGYELMNLYADGYLIEAIEYFKKAIDLDPLFAEAQAYTAVCYYFLDIFQARKQHTEEINSFADRALLASPELPISLIAKGLFYMHDQKFDLAVVYFEKALEYNPNSSMATNFLSDIYAMSIPNTKKYLKYALRGNKLNVALVDSAAMSISYLHLSNALAQAGFFQEAEVYAQKSIAFDEDNLFPQYLYPYIQFAQGESLAETGESLKAVLKKDTTRLDIMIEVAKIHYCQEEYESAAFYYDVFTEMKETFGLDIFDSEEIKIAYTYKQLGRLEEANKHLAVYKEFAEKDDSIYRDLLLSAYYAYIGDNEKGIYHLKRFPEQKDYFYWLVMMLEDDPIMKRMKDHPEFLPTLKEINDQFWDSHKSTRIMLEEEGLLFPLRENW
ncbi:helix-turn-helix domain-containing protein [Roseivirga sp.]|uniref:helix-turn-helix domain-containing protein n=1 Tax=Roseivirga sp. TaxID=1964215 RepID=UPI003B8D287E